MQATSTAVPHVDTSRYEPKYQGKLIRTPYQGQEDQQFNHHITSLMLAIRGNRRIVTTRSSTRTKTGKARASVSWKTPTGAWNSFILESSQFYCQGTEEDAKITSIDGEEPWLSLADKLLTAINENCYVSTHLLEGSAVLSWDRVSHGNTPTIVLDHQDNFHDYYNWPYHLPAHLEPKHTPETTNTKLLDHFKPLRPQAVPAPPNTECHLFQEQDPSTLSNCETDHCPATAFRPAVDERNWNHGQFCNYHLYGPRGYAQTKQDFPEFKDWLKETNHRLANMLPLELHAEKQRALTWSHHHNPKPPPAQTP